MLFSAELSPSKGQLVVHPLNPTLHLCDAAHYMRKPSAAPYPASILPEKKERHQSGLFFILSHISCLTDS